MSRTAGIYRKQPSGIWIKLGIGLDTTPPSTPTDLTQTALSPVSVSISWGPSTDDVGVAGYEISYNGDTVEVGPLVTAATLSGLTPDTDYDLEVRALDSRNRSAAATLSVHTPAPGGFTQQKGWLYSHADIGLAQVGLFGPDLPLYTGTDTPTAGATISEKRITKPLDLSAGVTLERCYVPLVQIGDLFGAYPADDVIEVVDCEIDGSAYSGMGPAFTTAFRAYSGAPFNVRRTWIHGIGRGWWLDGEGTVEDCIMDDSTGFGDPATTGSHNECFTRRGADGHITYQRCILDVSAAPANASAAAQVLAQGGETGDLELSECYLSEGGVYALAVGVNPGTVIDGSVDVIDNRWAPTAGLYDIADPDWIGTWTDNYRYDAAAVDQRGALINGPS